MAEKGHKLLVISLTTVFFAVVPFLFWRATWFGGKLNEAELQRYLVDRNPRNVQHALAQAAERLIKGEHSDKSWYPQVAAMADYPRVEIRSTAAWVMGQDNSSREFHAALLRLLHDREPLVRRNAALSLVRFGDQEGRPELLAMLHPYTIDSPRGGTASIRLSEDEFVNPGTLMARVVAGRDQETEVRSPLPGRVLKRFVEDGQQIKEGDRLFELAPSPEQVWEALRALVLVGRAEDLADVEKVGRSLGDTGSDARLRQQADLTSRAIRSRL